MAIVVAAAVAEGAALAGFEAGERTACRYLSAAIDFEYCFDRVALSHLYSSEN